MQTTGQAGWVLTLLTVGLVGCSGDFTAYPLLPTINGTSNGTSPDAGVSQPHPDGGANQNPADAGTGVLDAGTDGCADGPPGSAVAPDTVNVSCFTTTFEDDFKTYDISSGPFADGLHENEKWFNGTDQCCMAPQGDGTIGGVMYPTPGQVTGQPVNPYSLIPGGGLQIELSRSDNEWFSGVMTSVDGNEQGFSQMYGYFEIKTQMAPGYGTFQSFWMLSMDRDTPGGEIDIFEQLGTDTSNNLADTQRIFHTTFIDWRPQGKREEPGYWAWANDSQYGADGAAKFAMTPDLTADYHRIGLLWNQTYAAVYFDGVLYNSRPTPEIMKGREYFMLVDNGIGGGGWDTSLTNNPANMLIQYVRAYSVPGF